MLPLTIHRQHAMDDHASSTTTTTSTPPHPGPVPFGREMRALFNFAPTFRPMNHGSWGTFPRALLDERFALQRAWEARADIYKYQDVPRLIVRSREALAPMFGLPDASELVLVPNASTGVNTVLRNLKFEEGDVVIYFSSIYDACRRTVESLAEMTPVTGWSIEVQHPIGDDELIAKLREGVRQAEAAGKRVVVADFETVLSLPGLRLPWERLCAVCKELGVLSLVDAAHGIGHIDMRHTSDVSPDFLVTNCHKWLFTPRGCAALYVPKRNQHLIATPFPTYHAYEPPAVRSKLDPNAYFVDLFVDVATADISAYFCVPAAQRFRAEVCGGEDRIREHCFGLARRGGDRVAEMLGTGPVMDNPEGTARECCFANVRLPIEQGRNYEGGEDGEDVRDITVYLYDTAMNEFDTYFQVKYYFGDFWVRLSAQVYLEMEDFEWSGQTLLELCRRVREGAWRK